MKTYKLEGRKVQKVMKTTCIYIRKMETERKARIKSEGTEEKTGFN
jgi:hypothetical protein